MSDASRFMPLWDFFRKFQAEYAGDWRNRVVPGLTFRLTKSVNTKLIAGPDKKAILDSDGKRQYVVKDPSKVYDAEIVRIGPERGEEGMDTPITVTTLQGVDTKLNEETGREEDVLGPVQETFALSRSPYYIDVSSVQHKAGRRGRTLRRRASRKTRRGRKH
jgi:hypothetical protein